MNILNCIAASILMASLCAGQASAATTPENPLSPYVGQCILLVVNGHTTNGDSQTVPGILVAAHDTYVELNLGGVPIFTFMSQVSLAFPDTSSEPETCSCDPPAGDGLLPDLRIVEP